MSPKHDRDITIDPRSIDIADTEVHAGREERK